MADENLGTTNRLEKQFRVTELLLFPWYSTFGEVDTGISKAGRLPICFSANGAFYSSLGQRPRSQEDKR